MLLVLWPVVASALKKGFDGEGYQRAPNQYEDAVHDCLGDFAAA